MRRRSLPRSYHSGVEDSTFRADLRARTPAWVPKGARVSERRRTLQVMPPGPVTAPRVSVVVPVFNRASYVAQTLRSVLAQSFENFELIVVDDGSQDDSYERVIALNDPRIVCVRQPNSGRPAVPRNLGIRMARGSLIAFLDSDDVWLPEALERQIRVLDQRPDAGMAYGLATRFDDLRELGMAGPKIASLSDRIFEQLLLDGNFIPMASVMVRSEALQQLGGFDERPSFKAVEDFDLWLRMAHDYPALLVPHVIARYRVHSENLSGDQRAMVLRVRHVLEVNCERFDVAPALRDRVMSRSYVEELKAELLEGSSVALARAALVSALERDPRNRTARWASAALNIGLHRPMQLAYRNRRYFTYLRSLVNRFQWLLFAERGAAGSLRSDS